MSNCVASYQEEMAVASGSHTSGGSLIGVVSGVVTEKNRLQRKSVADP